MNKKKLFSLLSFLLLVACQPKTPQFTVHYTQLEQKDSTILYLWQINADLQATDGAFKPKLISQAMVKNGTVTFPGDVDTLHLYAISERDYDHMGIFYANGQKVTLQYEGNKRFNLQMDSLQSPYLQMTELSIKNYPPKETREFIFAKLKNATGICMLSLSEYASVYPDELETIYEESNPVMRDSTILLVVLKYQLDQTVRMETGTAFADFRQKKINGPANDPVAFSDIAGKGKPVCLLFLMARKQTAPIHPQLAAWQKTYPDMQWVIVAPAPTNTETADLLQDLEKTYRATLIEANTNANDSTRWLYRIKSRINYAYIFNGEGKLEIKKPIE